MEATTFWEFLQTLSWDTAILSIIGLLIIGGFFVIIVTGKYLWEHPEAIMEKIIKYNEAKHAKSFAYRMESSPKVEDSLDKLILESKASRAFIIEMHNGKYNSAGLSFNYGAMNYEAVKEGVQSIREDYVDFTLERFQLSYKVYKDGYWAGTLADLKAIDKRLSGRIYGNDSDITYVAFAVIYGEKSEIGFIGLTFRKGDEYTPEQVQKYLQKYAAQISPLLDGSVADK